MNFSFNIVAKDFTDLSGEEIISNIKALHATITEQNGNNTLLTENAMAVILHATLPDYTPNEPYLQVAYFHKSSRLICKTKFYRYALAEPGFVAGLPIKDFGNLIKACDNNRSAHNLFTENATVDIELGNYHKDFVKIIFEGSESDYLKEFLKVNKKTIFDKLKYAVETKSKGSFKEFCEEAVFLEVGLNLLLPIIEAEHPGFVDALEKFYCINAKRRAESDRRWIGERLIRMDLIQKDPILNSTFGAGNWEELELEAIVRMVRDNDWDFHIPEISQELSVKIELAIKSERHHRTHPDSF